MKTAVMVKKLPNIDGFLIGLRYSDMQAKLEGAAEEVELIVAILAIMVQKPSDAGNVCARSVAKPSGRAAVVDDETQDKEEILQEDLKAHIKSIFLLSNILTNSARMN